MKIERVSCFVLRVPLGEERFYSSQCAFPERNSLLVRIDTDEGLTGWGEGGQYGPSKPVAVCVDHVLAPLICGRDPMHRAVIWNDLYSATRDFGQKGSYIEAISAIDIALWDLAGKALGVPVHALLGGAVRDSVPAYATGCYYRGTHPFECEGSVQQLRQEAAGYVEQGFEMLKVKVGLLAVEEDARRLAAIREAVGPDVRLLVDCNHAYNSMTAVRMAQELERYGVLWMEEPVPPEDHAGYRRVRSRTNVPIAGGECEYTRYGFRDFLASGCVDIAQPDVCVCGGISEILKIATLADCYGVWVVPHVWGSGIALAAALQVLAAFPAFPHTAHPVPLQNEPVIEFDRNYNPLRDDLVSPKIDVCEGRVPVSDGPGLGVEVDEGVLDEYAVSDGVI